MFPTLRALCAECDKARESARICALAKRRVRRLPNRKALFIAASKVLDSSMYPKHDPVSLSTLTHAETHQSQNPRVRSANRGAGFFVQATKLALLALTAFATGCLGNVVYVDERFTDEEEASIRTSAETWTKATNGKATVDFIFGQRVDIRDKGRRVMVRAGGRAAENTFDLFREGDPGGRHESWDSEVIVIVPERMDGIDFQYVVTHELGHHFSVHHVADEAAIMYYRPNPKSAHCLTREDLSAFCGANACNVAETSPCDEDVTVRR
jgi:hypothetical protein